MKTVSITRFDRGIADDRLSGGQGQFAIAKQFDVLTNPVRLQPLRGMATHTAGTGIGNLVTASDGLLYGVGLNSANGRLYVLPGYGASDDFGNLTADQLSGAVPDYEFLVDWPDAGNQRRIHWASTNTLIASPYNGAVAVGAITQALTFTSIGQGFVHPKNKYLYFPYVVSAGVPKIGVYAPNATPFIGGTGSGAPNTFALPAQYRAYCLTNYGNYLAIPLTSIAGVSLVNSSIVALWDRDISNTLFSETIQWGAGALKVLNNLGGALIGVSELGSDLIQPNTVQDLNSVQIKIWDGGAEPTLIKELKINRVIGSATAANAIVTVNQRVNFVYNNRLYFSVNIVPGDGVQPARYGLYSVGRNKTTGEWTVQFERMATNTGTETSILAAALVGDYLETVHTTVGTLTKSINGTTSAVTFGATSVYESCVNPEMDPNDRLRKKQLYAYVANFLPLTVGASVTLKYRVDSLGSDSDWITVGTQSTAGETALEMSKAALAEFTSGRGFEFRIESTGGAIITAYAYRYDNMETQLT